MIAASREGAVIHKGVKTFTSLPSTGSKYMCKMRGKLLYLSRDDYCSGILSESSIKIISDCEM